MSSTDDQRASDDLVQRLAAKMASADHGTLPADAGGEGGASRTAASSGEGSGDGAGHDAAGGVVDLTGDAGDAVDLGDLVIDLDTYEAAHQLAVEEERSH